MITFGLTNAPTGAQSWAVAIYSAGGDIILSAPTTYSFYTRLPVDMSGGTYDLRFIVYSSAPGAGWDVLQTFDINNVSLESGGLYVYDCITLGWTEPVLFEATGETLDTAAASAALIPPNNKITFTITVDIATLIASGTTLSGFANNHQWADKFYEAGFHIDQTTTSFWSNTIVYKCTTWKWGNLAILTTDYLNTTNIYMAGLTGLQITLVVLGVLALLGVTAGVILTFRVTGYLQTAQEEATAFADKLVFQAGYSPSEAAKLISAINPVTQVANTAKWIAVGIISTAGLAFIYKLLGGKRYAVQNK